MALTQINKAGLDEIALDHVFTIGASGSSAYTFQGEGLNGTVNNPTLYLTRGKTYRFENGSGGHPIRIQSTSGASGTAYNTGVTNNAGSGTVIVEVQHDAPDVLYYQCTSHAAMNGILYITGALADGGVTTAKIADDAVTDAKLANSINAAIAANTAKTSNATHTGDVTGSTSLTIANNAVTTAKIADDAVTTAKIANGAVTNNEIANLTIANNDISNSAAINGSKFANNSISLAKLEHGTSSNNGKFLRANNGADPTFETVNTDLVSDTSPQLGGALDTNGHQIHVGDGGPNNTDENICLGDGKDLKIYHDGTNSAIYDNGNGRLKIYSNGAGIDLKKDTGDSMGIFNTDGSAELYHTGNKRFETTNDGIIVFRNTSDSTMTNTSHLVLRNENNGANTFAGIRFEVSSNTATDHFIVQKKHSGGSGTDLIIGHGSNERLRFVESGGFTFNGDTATANALDDYEEGSWTPLPHGYWSGGWRQATYTGSVDGATYTKIGRMVYFKCYINNVNFTNNASGANARIYGLPYTCASDGYGYVAYLSHVNMFNNTNTGSFYIAPGNTHMHATRYGESSVGNATWGTGGSLYGMISGVYQAA